MRHKRFLALVAALLWPLAMTQGCSLKRMAVNTIAESLTTGPSTFESDDDLVLVGEALPFALKLFESLLAQSPRHPGLLLTTCKAFTMYAYAYVHSPAEILAESDARAAEESLARARRLYMRAHGYGMRGLELARPGLGQELSRAPREAVAGMRPAQVPALYWTAASLGLAVSVSRDDVAMLARLGEVSALLDRALALDPDWQEGALYEFKIQMSGAGMGAEDKGRLREYYAKAYALSKGKRASLHVALAEAVCVPAQDRAEFARLLNLALSVDPAAEPENRLATLVAQRRARWLLGRVEDLFLGPEEEAGG